MSKTVSIILLVCALALCFVLGRCSKADPEAKVVVEIDTAYVTKIDTVEIEKPKYIVERVTDSIRIVIKETDTVFLPRVQRYYSEFGVYDAWVSGYEPQLDSIKTYNKTEYTTITKTVTETIIERKWNVWLGVGGGTWRGEFYPKAVLDINSPKTLGFSLEAGYLQGMPMWEAKVKVKLFEL